MEPSSHSFGGEGDGTPGGDSSHTVKGCGLGGARGPVLPADCHTSQHAHLRRVVPGPADRRKAAAAAHRRRVRGHRLAHRHRPSRRISRPDEDHLHQSGRPQLKGDHPPHARLPGLLPLPTPDRAPAPVRVSLGLARAPDALRDRREPQHTPPPVRPAPDLLLRRRPHLHLQLHQMSSAWPPNVHPLPLASAPAADAGTVAGLVAEVHRCQLRIALRFAAAEQGRLLHVPGLGWHGWDGYRWALDPGERVAKQSVMRAVRNARLQASSMRSAADREDLWRDAKSCETSPGVRGVLELGAALAELSALPGELDVNPHLLNTPRGTLDLSTGRTHPCLPADFLTKVTGCPFEPGAGGSAWDTFLAATLPDADVRAFLQRVVGLALVGKVIEHGA